MRRLPLGYGRTSWFAPVNIFVLAVGVDVPSIAQYLAHARQEQLILLLGPSQDSRA